MRRLLSIFSMVVALLGFTTLANAQELGGQIGFAGTFSYDNNTSPTEFASFTGVTVASTPAPTGSFVGLGGQSATFTPFSFTASSATPLWSITSGSNTYWLDASITSADLSELPSVVSFSGPGTVSWSNGGTVVSSPAEWSLSADSNNGFNLLISMTSVEGNGTSPVLNPSFGSEIYSLATGSSNNPPGRCSISSNVAVGQRIVVLAMEDGNDYYVSNVTDSKGNSYSQVAYYNNTNFQNCNQSIWSAYATSGLTAGADTITITWSPTVTAWRQYAISIVTLNNTQPTGQPDSTAKNNAYMYTNTVSIPGTTVATNTVAVGFLAANYFDWTIGNGTMYDNMSSNIFYDFFYNVNSSAGVYNPGGSAGVRGTFSGTWAAFK